MLGVLVFAFGELLNRYHHWLLARLRPPGVRTYGAPRGGLFGWVASPHYLGEILSFVGCAMMSDLLPVWGNALVVSAYLATRANTTLRWYQREMSLRIPSGWRRLVPFALLGRDCARIRRQQVTLPARPASVGALSLGGRGSPRISKTVTP